MSALCKTIWLPLVQATKKDDVRDPRGINGIKLMEWGDIQFVEL